MSAPIRKAVPLINVERSRSSRVFEPADISSTHTRADLKPRNQSPTQIIQKDDPMQKGQKDNAREKQSHQKEDTIRNDSPTKTALIDSHRTPKKPPMPKLYSGRPQRILEMTSRKDSEVFEEVIDLRALTQRSRSEEPRIIAQGTQSLSPVTMRYNEKQEKILQKSYGKESASRRTQKDELFGEWNRKQGQRSNEWESVVSNVETMIESIRTVRQEHGNTSSNVSPEFVRKQEKVKSPEKNYVYQRKGVPRLDLIHSFSSDEDTAKKATARIRRKHMNFPHRETELAQYISNLIAMNPSLNINDMNTPVERVPGKKSRALHFSPTRPNSAPSTCRSYRSLPFSSQMNTSRLSRADTFELRDKRIEQAQIKRSEMQQIVVEKYEKKKEKEESKGLITSRSVYEQIQTEKKQMEEVWDSISRWRMWLTIIALASRERKIVLRLKKHRDDKEHRKKLKRACLTIQRSFRSYLAKVRARKIIEAMKVIRRTIKRYIVWWRQEKARRSINIIINFILSFQKLPPAAIAVRKYYFKVIQAQRVWRRFIALFKAQRELLFLQWDKIEAQMLGREEPVKTPTKSRAVSRTRSVREVLEARSASPANMRATSTNNRQRKNSIVAPSSRRSSVSSVSPPRRPSMTPTPIVTTPRKSKQSRSHTNTAHERHERYVSMIPNHIRDALLRPHIVQANREYREAQRHRTAELANPSNVQSKVNQIVASSSPAVIAMLSDNLGLGARTTPSRPSLRILMRPEAMRRLVEEGFKLHEQERHMDQYFTD